MWTAREERARFLDLVFTQDLGWTAHLLKNPDWGYLRVGVDFGDDPHNTVETVVTAPVPLDFHPGKAEHAEASIEARLGYACDFNWEFSKGLLTVRHATQWPIDVRWDGTPPAVWDRLLVGHSLDGPVHWDLRRAPHMLVCGRTRSGKSTIMDALARQAQAAEFKLAFVDPKVVEFTPWQNRSGVLTVVTGLPETANLMRSLEAEQASRYRQMVDAGVDHWTKLSPPPPPLLVAVDECGGLLRQAKPAGMHKGPNLQRASVSGALLDIAERGAAAGIHLLLACQRTEADWFVGSLKLNCGARVLAGHTDLANWQVMMGQGTPYPDGWDGTDVTVPMGRGHVYVNGSVAETQLLRAV